MQRRSFIQSLLAIPVVALAAKLPSPDRSNELNGFSEILNDGATGRQLEAFRHNYNRTRLVQLPATAPIRKGDLLRTNQFVTGVIPMDGGGGWFAGVAQHDAMEGDLVLVMVEGVVTMSAGSYRTAVANARVQ